MARRNSSYDQYISEQMQDLEFARESLLANIEEFEDSVEESLKKTIGRMGLKEFSLLSGIPIQNISSFIKGKRNLKRETLDKYLAVFGLKSKLVVVDENNVA